MSTRDYEKTLGISSPRKVMMTKEQIEREEREGNIETRTETRYLPLESNPEVAVPVPGAEVKLLKRRDGSTEEIIEKFW
jgi:hypothetical protein